MSDRLFMLVAVLLISGVVWGVWQLAVRHRLRRLVANDLPAALAARLDTRQANLLYFTADHCAQCRLQQTPILTQLGQTLPVRIHTIDAVKDAELAGYFGVMTVPTTIVLDRSRRPAAVNHGLAPLPRLVQQLTTSHASSSAA